MQIAARLRAFMQMQHSLIAEVFLGLAGAPVAFETPRADRRSDSAGRVATAPKVLMSKL